SAYHSELHSFPTRRSSDLLSYTLNNTWSTGVGSIFTPLNRVRPSFFLQYFRKGKTTSVMVYPRIDLWENPNLELMGFIEYKGTRSEEHTSELQSRENLVCR